MFKEGAFEPSLLLRHSVDYNNIITNAITTVVETKAVLFIYSDRSKDHRPRVNSIDGIVPETRPLLSVCCENSSLYRNPVERIMSTNIHMQVASHCPSSKSNVTRNGSRSREMQLYESPTSSS